MTSGLVRLLLIACVIAFGSVAMGCDDDGELSLEEYFERLDEIGDESDAESDALEDTDIDEGDFRCGARPVR